MVAIDSDPAVIFWFYAETRVERPRSACRDFKVEGSLPQKAGYVHVTGEILFRWQKIPARLQKLFTEVLKIKLEIAILFDYPCILSSC
jgi:hypothetical protein